VAAGIDGIVAAVRVEVGDRVEAGQVLLTIDRARLEPALALRRAGLAAAGAAVLAATAAEDLAALELRRADGLRGSGAFNQARYEDARRNLERARSQTAAARAEVDAGRAARDLAAVDLDRADVRAPFGGVVTARTAEVGGHVEEGDPVVNLLDDASFEVEAEVPIDRLGGLAPGSVAALTWPDGSNGQATVRALIPAENPLSRTRPVRLVPDRPPAVAADRQTVTVAVPRAAARAAVTVAKDGIVFAPDGATAIVVDAEGATTVRSLRLGQSTGERIEVLEGLAEGESVVVRGNERLEPGQKVRVAEPDAPGSAS
jgi:RND family efflux transporter MFP subunit